MTRLPGLWRAIRCWADHGSLSACWHLKMQLYLYLPHLEFHHLLPGYVCIICKVLEDLRGYFFNFFYNLSLQNIAENGGKYLALTSQMLQAVFNVIFSCICLLYSYLIISVHFFLQSPYIPSSLLYLGYWAHPVYKLFSMCHFQFQHFSLILLYIFHFFSERKKHFCFLVLIKTSLFVYHLFLDPAREASSWAAGFLLSVLTMLGLEACSRFLH